jgi:hypothetical protein
MQCRTTILTTCGLTVDDHEIEVSQIGMFGFDKIGEFLHREEEEIELLVEILETVQKLTMDAIVESVDGPTVLQLEYQ